MCKISIPKRFSNRLDKLPKEDKDKFFNAIEKYESWYSNKTNMFFFPEYTDHGLEHVKSMILLSDQIISDVVWGEPDSENYLFTAFDIGILVLSIFIHDIGMHLTIDSFKDLINSNQHKTKYNWEDEWSKYNSYAYKWDDKKRKSIYDDYDSPPIIDINNINDLIKREKYYIGEFIRQNHHKIAYEISVNDLRLRDIPTIASFRETERIIIGLIAESHCLNVRNYFDKLNEMKYHPSVLDCHPLFLAVVLRIVDILHIKRDRINSNIKVDEIENRVSKIEWMINKSVASIELLREDPEQLVVFCENDDNYDLEVHLRLTNYLHSVQNELDQCFAILGEAYGKFNGLQNLTMKYRRIDSNMFNSEFEKSLSFVPQKAEFKANAEIVKLMINPMYGEENPQYAIRELLQNATDAVRELDYYLEKNPQLTESVKKQQVDFDKEYNLEEVRRHSNSRGSYIINDGEGKTNVVILIDKEKWVVEVRDNGIGMTSDTIIDYFLQAGASFRISDVWKTEFTDNGKSEVARSGRFGVGIFSTFLLGDEIDVETRYVKDKRGLRFKAKIDDEQIQINYATEDIHIGTKIVIKLKQSIVKVFEDASFSNYQGYGIRWDWWCVNYPKVVFLLQNKEPEIKNDNRFYSYHKYTEISQKLIFPSEKDDISDINWHDWREIKFEGFHKIYYDSSNHGNIVCNGIHLFEKTTGVIFTKNYFSFPYNIDIFTPNLSVIDCDAILPLDIKRTDFNSSVQFKEELENSIVKEMFTLILSIKDIKLNIINGLWHRNFSIHMNISPFALTKKGIILYSFKVFKKTYCDGDKIRILFVTSINDSTDLFKNSDDLFDMISFIVYDEKLKNIWFNNAIKTLNTITDKSIVKLITQSDKDKELKRISDLEIRNLSEDDVNFDNWIKERKINALGYFEGIINENMLNEKNDNDDKIGSIYIELFDNECIPYSYEERKKIIDKIHPHIEYFLQFYNRFLV